MYFFRRSTSDPWAANHRIKSAMKQYYRVCAWRESTKVLTVHNYSTHTIHRHRNSLHVSTLLNGRCGLNVIYNTQCRPTRDAVNIAIIWRVSFIEECSRILIPVVWFIIAIFCVHHTRTFSWNAVIYHDTFLPNSSSIIPVSWYNISSKYWWSHPRGLETSKTNGV